MVRIRQKQRAGVAGISDLAVAYLFREIKRFDSFNVLTRIEVLEWKQTLSDIHQLSPRIR